MYEKTASKLRKTNQTDVKEPNKVTSPLADQMKRSFNRAVSRSFSRVEEINVRHLEKKRAELEEKYQQKEAELVASYEQTYRKFEEELLMKEKDILEESKRMAEAILEDVYKESETIYRGIQLDAKKLKSSLKVTKERAEQEKKRLDEELQERLEELNNVYTLKYREMEQEIAEGLEELTKEKEQLEEMRQQTEKKLDGKEKALFLVNKSMQEKAQLKELELQNQIEFYRVLNVKRKINSFRAALSIFGLSGLNVILLTLFQYTTAVIPIMIACLAFYLVNINLTEGKVIKENKAIAFQNASLIEETKEQKRQLKHLESDLRKALEDKTAFEKQQRAYDDNIKYLKILQKDLKQSEINRKILESENTALRKHLITQKTAEDAVMFNET